MSTIETLPAHVPAEWRPKPQDELLHEPFGDESLPWKETFFITLHDVSNGLSINMHQTVSANRAPDTRQAIGVSQGLRNISVVCREDGTHTDTQIGNSQSRLEMINLSWDSDHELRWVGDTGEASWDLVLKGKHWAPLWDTMFKGFYATGTVDGQVYRHTEQIITATGTIAWAAEQPQQFAGVGWRDRGWGRRKTQLMWNSGWDLMGAVLPDDSVFAIIALRSHELPEPAPQPVAGWWSSADTLTPCVGGYLHKEATAVPLRYELHFENGHRIAAEFVRQSGRVAVAMQESEVGPNAPNWATGFHDLYCVFRDEDGNEFPVFHQQGYVHKVDAFRGAQFIHAGNPPVKG
jgi:hypothetical protein